MAGDALAGAMTARRPRAFGAEDSPRSTVAHTLSSERNAGLLLSGNFSCMMNGQLLNDEDDEDEEGGARRGDEDDEDDDGGRRWGATRTTTIMNMITGDKYTYPMTGIN